MYGLARVADAPSAIQVRRQDGSVVQIVTKKLTLVVEVEDCTLITNADLEFFGQSTKAAVLARSNLTATDIVVVEVECVERVSGAVRRARSSANQMQAALIFRNGTDEVRAARPFNFTPTAVNSI